MTIASTQAYQDLKPENKRQRVFNAIATELDGFTIAELSGGFGWPVNWISSRVSELADAGMIRFDGMRGGQTIWVYAEPIEREALIAKRLEDKKRAEIRAVIEYGDCSYITVRVPGHKHFEVGQRVKVS